MTDSEMKEALTNTSVALDFMRRDRDRLREFIRERIPVGHEGDDESGEHYHDCELCAFEGILAQSEHEAP